MWIWNNEGSLFYFDIGETVRFRVEAEEWHDQIPDAPDAVGNMESGERRPPYSIIVRFVLCLWIIYKGLIHSRGLCKWKVLDQ